MSQTLAQARGVVVQRHGGIDRTELVDGAQVDLDDAVPAVVLAADAFELPADLLVLDVEAEGALQRVEGAVDVLLP